MVDALLSPPGLKFCHPRSAVARCLDVDDLRAFVGQVPREAVTIAERSGCGRELGAGRSAIAARGSVYGQDPHPARQVRVGHPACHRWGMTTDGAHARDLRAVYAFRGLPEELNRTLPLDADERVILEGTLLCYRIPVLPRISYVRLTSDRFVLLRHYGWRPDTVTEVPPRAVQEVDRKGARLEMTWTGHDDRTPFISLAPWATVIAARRRPITNLDQLTSDLRAWLSSVGWTQPGTN